MLHGEAIEESFALLQNDSHSALLNNFATRNAKEDAKVEHRAQTRYILAHEDYEKLPQYEGRKHLAKISWYYD